MYLFSELRTIKASRLSSKISQSCQPLVIKENSMKYWVGLLCLFLTTANAIPFGFKYGQSKESVPYPVIDTNYYQFCKLTNYDKVNAFFIPLNPNDYTLSKKVRSDYNKIGINLSSSINDLKNAKTRDFLIDFPFYIFPSSSDDELKKLAHVKDEHKMTDVSKRKRYIFEKLIQENIFKEFSNYKATPYQFETRVYQLPNMKVCAQFKNNALVQVGFNNEGVSKSFNKIVNAITSKYKGNSKIYELKKHGHRVAICGYINATDDCFVKEYNASTNSGENIKILYRDTTFESSFFSKALPEKDIGYKFQFVNYLDGKNLFAHEAAIEKEQIEFNTTIMKKLYLRLQDLFNESKHLKKEKDSFLEQF